MKTSKFLGYFLNNINHYSSAETLYYYAQAITTFSSFPQVSLPKRVIPYKKNIKVKFMMNDISGASFSANKTHLTLGLYKHGKKLRTAVTISKSKSGDFFADIDKEKLLYIGEMRLRGQYNDAA